MNEWRGKIRKIATNVKKLYFYFNNCHEGQAAKNGLQFQEMMKSELFQ